MHELTTETAALAGQTSSTPSTATPIDFSLYTRAMLDEEKSMKPGGAPAINKDESSTTQFLFSKKPLLKISKLRLTPHQPFHLKENRLS